MNIFAYKMYGEVFHHDFGENTFKKEFCILYLKIFFFKKFQI